MPARDESKKGLGALKMALGVLFWLVVWQLGSMALAQVLFLPSPLQAAAALWGLVGTGRFWFSIANSLAHIGAGLLLGVALGVGLGVLAFAFEIARVLLRPLMQLVRAVPVASFIILALIWVNVQGLSTFVSFLIVLPVIYNATTDGLESADARLLEMADAFHMTAPRRARYIYLPAMLPRVLSGCELALGLCWKSGVAAEVIGLPDGTIGERLYMAKINLQTPGVFAWTFVIILLSWALGKVVMWLLNRAAKGLRRARPVSPARTAAQVALKREDAGPGAVYALRGVDKSYGEGPVLAGFSLDVAPGEAVALAGPSGRGKTTAVRLLLGLEPPDGGRVDVPANPRIACVFQEDRLCEDFGAAQNVAMVLPACRRGDVAGALAKVGIAGEMQNRPVASLSGGEKRRVALVRAVEADSDLLVLDEAFKGLDDEARARARAYVRDNLRGRALLLITHDLADAEDFGARVTMLDS